MSIISQDIAIIVVAAVSREASNNTILTGPLCSARRVLGTSGSEPYLNLVNGR